jgi:catechol 2,3-dioxygenase-like lactoylglutathione lyase family enzyme
MIDRLVLATSRREACIDFYARVLGMKLDTFVGGTPPVERLAFRFGRQKIRSVYVRDPDHNLIEISELV